MQIQLFNILNWFHLLQPRHNGSLPLADHGEDDNMLLKRSRTVEERLEGRQQRDDG